MTDGFEDCVKTQRDDQRAEMLQWQPVAAVVSHDIVFVSTENRYMTSGQRTEKSDWTHLTHTQLLTMWCIKCRNDSSLGLKYILYFNGPRGGRVVSALALQRYDHRFETDVTFAWSLCSHSLHTYKLILIN